MSQNLAYTTAIQPKTIITNTSTLQTDRAPAAFTNQITELREKIHLLSTSNLIIAANIQKSMSTEALDTIVNKNHETDVKFRYKFTDPDAEPVRRSWPRKDRKSLDLESVTIPITSIGSTETLSESEALPPPLPVSRPPTIISSLRKSEIIINDELLKTEVAKKSEKSVQFRRTPTPPAPELDFKPIKASQSTENLSAILLKPIPRYPPSLSKSTQDLRAAVKDPEFKKLRAYEISKSSDDLIFPDIDGLRKSQRLNKRWRMRSHESITSVDDEELYANLPISSFTKQPSESVTIIKKPLPLPRQNSFTTESLNDLRETTTDLQTPSKSKSSVDLRPRIDSSDDRRGSKTVVYVFDKVADEFVLQSSDPDTSYEDLIEKSEVPVAPTTVQRNSQVVKIAVAAPTTPTRVHPVEVTIATKARTTKSKFSFFGIGKKTPERDPNASTGFYGSKASLVEEQIVDNEFGENPLFRIKSMEDLNESNVPRKSSIGSTSLSTFKTTSFSREAIVASARKSSSSNTSVFYVPNPSDAAGNSASSSKFSVVL